MDLDDEIRTELLLDARKWLDETGPLDGILITGDIAYSGESGQYESARTWLRTVSETVGCDPSSVWVVPGNHDVNRSAIRKNKLLQMIQARVRGHSADAPDALNKEIREVCLDEGTSQLLLTPLEEFNAFAATYGSVCCTTTQGLAWRHDLPFDRGYTLRLWGINSAVVSNEHDRVNSLVVSGHQLPQRAPGVVHVALCHHPPEWILDSQQVIDRLDSRASIQLYGHRHRRRTRSSTHSLVLHAGALHPERNDNEWTPRYNVISLEVEVSDGTPRLAVQVWGREWKDEESKFGPMTMDGVLVGRYTVSLDDVPPVAADSTPVVKPRPASALAAEEREALAPHEELPDDDEALSAHGTTDAMDSMRSLVYLYYDLPFHRRQGVLVDLDLLRDEDQGVSERVLVRRVVERVRAEGLLSQFSNAVESAHP